MTIVEMLVVLAVLGALLGVAGVSLRAPAARLFANDVKGQIEQARYEAVKRNRPVSVMWDADAGEFVTRVGTAAASIDAACDASTALVLLTRTPSSYRNVSVTFQPTSWASVAWLPSGQGRTCSGGPGIETTITVTDGRTTRTVGISLGGRVSLQ